MKSLIENSKNGRYHCKCSPPKVLQEMPVLKNCGNFEEIIHDMVPFFKIALY